MPHAHTSAVYVLFYRYMIQNMQSHIGTRAIIQCDVTIIGISKTLSILTKNTVTKILQKRLYCEYANAIQKILDKLSIVLLIMILVSSIVKICYKVFFERNI